jgi:hypothetical protein
MYSRDAALLAGRDLIASACWDDAEASASSDASASSYSRPEDVRVLAIVVAELKLIQVQRQIFLAHVVISADYAALQKRPERFQIVGMHFAAHVFMRLVIDVLMRKSLIQLLIASGLIRGNERNLIRYRVADESAHGIHRSIFDDCADHVALTAYRSDDRSLAGWSAPWLFLVPVAVAVQAADVSLVYFDNAHELTEIRIGQTGAQAVTHKPRRAIRAGADHAMDLQRTDALLAGQHQVQNLKPYEQLVIRVLEDGSDEHREPIGSVATFFANPVECASLECVDLLVAAARATDGLRPAARDQIRLTSGFVREQAVKLRKRHLTRNFRFGGIAHRN